MGGPCVLILFAAPRGRRCYYPHMEEGEVWDPGSKVTHLGAQHSAGPRSELLAFCIHSARNSPAGERWGHWPGSHDAEVPLL